MQKMQVNVEIKLFSTYEGLPKIMVTNKIFAGHKTKLITQLWSGKNNLAVQLYW